jgi:hypothetical protein
MEMVVSILIGVLSINLLADGANTDLVMVDFLTITPRKGFEGIGHHGYG